MTITLEAEVVRVLVSPPVQDDPGTMYLVSRRTGAVRAALEGLEGDRHWGFTRPADSRTPHYPRGTPIHNTRQVSLVAAEELAQVAMNMGLAAVEPEWIGANLVLRGVPNLSALPPFTRLFFPDEAVIALEGENHPCLVAGKSIQMQRPDMPGLGKRFPKAAIHLRGVVGWIERAGTIREGDTVRIAVPEHAAYAPPAILVGQP